MKKTNHMDGVGVNSKDIIITGVKLMFIVMVSVSILSYVNSITEERIANIEKERFERGLREVVPLAYDFEKIDENVFVAYSKGGSIRGKIYFVESKGYNGVIEMLVGINSGGRIIKVSVVKHMETPGLGSNVDDEDFLKQFEGKSIEQIGLAKKGSGDIDAISGATTSSNAVINGVRSAIEMWGDDR